MPSFQDSAIIFVLALLLFGPKKLPVLARELGKWLGEFRRASNDFKMQMEEELRISEQDERMKKLDAMQAAAPVAPALENTSAAEPPPVGTDSYSNPEILPIATSGELSIMPPSTGLPIAQTSDSDLTPLIDSIPIIDAPDHNATAAAETTESAAHG